jgi:hypothetical protein
MPLACAASSACAIWRAYSSASPSGRPGDAEVEARASRSAKCVAFDELEHQAAHVLAFFDAVDRGDVRVIQRRNHAGLALEARQPFGRGDERRRKDFDGDVALEPRVAGAIDITHAAASQQRLQVIHAEPAPNERSGRGRGVRDRE